MNKKRFWTEEKIEALIKIYPNTRTEDIAKQFGFSVSAIYNKAYSLKIKKDIEFIRETARKNSLNPNHGGRKCLFKKGSAPSNKGKKQTEFMSQEAIERTKATRFKKGNIPANHKPVGYERITADGYIEVKVKEPNKFKPKHRIVWEEHNGKIPQNNNIQFKDGNRQNISIENLYMISQKEQMIENSGSINLLDGMVAVYLAGERGQNKALIKDLKENHPKLIELKRQQLLLNRKIKKHGN